MIFLTIDNIDISVIDVVIINKFGDRRFVKEMASFPLFPVETTLKAPSLFKALRITFLSSVLRSTTTTLTDTTTFSVEFINLKARLNKKTYEF